MTAAKIGLKTMANKILTENLTNRGRGRPKGAPNKNTQAIKDCFSASADAGTLPQATDVDPTWTNTTDAAAYCVKWDITCTASRTCDTWAPGGPIVD